MNPRAYIKRHDENEREKQRKLKVVMESEKPKLPKSGRKTKKQKEVEDRMKDQASFLLFLEKEKAAEKSTEASS